MWLRQKTYQAKILVRQFWIITLKNFLLDIQNVFMNVSRCIVSSSKCICSILIMNLQMWNCDMLEKPPLPPGWKSRGGFLTVHISWRQRGGDMKWISCNRLIHTCLCCQSQHLYLCLCFTLWFPWLWCKNQEIDWLNDWIKYQVSDITVNNTNKYNEKRISIATGVRGLPGAWS